MLILTVRMPSGKEVEEKHDPRHLVDPRALSRGSTRRMDRVSVKTNMEAAEWGRALIERFNDTRVAGEGAREFVSVRFESVPNADRAAALRKRATAKLARALELEDQAESRRAEARKLYERAEALESAGES